MFDMSWSPSVRQLRQFAWACLPGFALFGWAAHRWTGGWTAAAVLGTLGVALWLLGLARPTALRLPYVALMLVAAPIGWVVTRVGLLVVFFVVLVPLALVFRLIGRDALGLRAHGRKTAWEAAPPAREPASYYRMS